MKVSYKVLFATVLAVGATNAFAAAGDAPAITGLATTNYVKGAIESLDSSVTTANGAIDTITETDGKITATHKLLKNADIAIDAKIATSKIDGLGSLATKSAITTTEITDGTITNADISGTAAIEVSKISGAQTTANLVDEASVTANKDSDTKYPSMKAAYKIADERAAEALKNTSAAVTQLQADLKATNEEIHGEDGSGGMKAMIEEVMGKVGDEDVSDQIDAAIADLDGTTSGTGTVVKGVTQTNGVVTTTLGYITSADITDGTIAAADLGTNSVTTVKISDKNVTKAKLEQSVQTSLGKADNSLQKAASATFTNGHVLKADASGNIVDGGALGALAVKDTVVAADIEAGAVTATKVADGLIKAGDNIEVTRNTTTGEVTVKGTYSYSLPNANGTTLGGVKTGGDMTATSGTLTITNGKVTTAKIADDAVTTAKIKGYDNSGTTKECEDGKCALVDLGSGAQWLKIVNEYPAN